MWHHRVGSGSVLNIRRSLLLVRLGMRHDAPQVGVFNIHVGVCGGHHGGPSQALAQLGGQLQLLKISRTRDVLLRGLGLWRRQFALVMLGDRHMLHLVRDMMLWLLMVLLVMSLMMLMVFLVILCALSTSGVVKGTGLHGFGSRRRVCYVGILRLGVSTRAHGCGLLKMQLTESDKRAIHRERTIVTWRTPDAQWRLMVVELNPQDR